MEFLLGFVAALVLLAGHPKWVVIRESDAGKWLEYRGDVYKLEKVSLYDELDYPDD